MSKVSLSDYMTLFDNKISLESTQEDLFLSASEQYLEEINPPPETIKRIREILESNSIDNVLIQIKEQNPTLFSYYLYKELDLRILLLRKRIYYISNNSSNINSKNLMEAKNALENVKIKRNTSILPFQEMEYVDSIFEKITNIGK
ncbi:hypothetical protein GX618_00920 [Candidatus Dojkabacteria bacterium]|uniref:Uncharacterized protein n=1 Tax=Candidatus Dojkabacteria bacterium TaxID=2099670 RepID=A0A847ES84_9BACT|nr:hypothetical protein [Candidatus Dojkabacteria bacterium]